MDRRDFLKLTALAGSAVTFGAMGQHQGPARARLTIGAWRVRPGAPLGVEMEVVDPGAQQKHTDAVQVQLIALDEQGRPTHGLGPLWLELAPSQTLTGSFVAPEAPMAGAESYRLAAAGVDGQGQVVVSDHVEVVCTPQLVGL